MNLIDRALLLGIEGRRLLPSNATTGGLETALSRTPIGLERVLQFGASSTYPGVSLDGHWLAAPGTDGNVRIFDVSTSRKVRTLRGHNRDGGFVAVFNRDATMVAAGGLDGRVDIWRVANGAPVVRPLTVGRSAVYGIFDPTDPRRLFTVSSDGRVVRWSLGVAHAIPDGDPFTFPTSPGDTPVGVVSPDGRLLAAGGASTRRTAVWDIATHRRLYEVPGAPGGFTSDGARLATADTDHVGLWDAASGRPDGAALSGFSAAAPATVSSADSRLLAVGDQTDGNIRVFSMATREPVRPPLLLHATFAAPIAFLPDGRLLTSGTDEAAVWRLSAIGAPLERSLRGHTGAAVGQFDPRDGSVITSGLDDHRVLSWGPTGSTPAAFLPGRSAIVAPVAFSGDGARVALGGIDGTLEIWDRRTGRQLSSTTTGATGGLTVAWDPKAPIVATADLEHPSDVLLWDLRVLGHPVVARRLHAASATDSYPSLTFSPDGRLLAANEIGRTVDTGSVNIFELHGARTRHLLQEGTDTAQVAFTPDGKTMAMVVGTSNGTGRVALWDTHHFRGRSETPLPYLPAGVAFVDGGAHLVSISFASEPAEAATRIDLWQTSSLEQIGESIAVPGTGAFLPVANPSGTQVAIGTADGGVTVLDVGTRSWRHAACHVAGPQPHARRVDDLPAGTSLPPHLRVSVSSKLRRPAQARLTSGEGTPTLL